MVQKIDKNTLSWRGNAPVSDHFTDVYYSEENGLEETDFVFLQGIRAPDCWASSSSFVIAETGFGTGLNFLATYKSWIESGASGQLTFISTEKFPLCSQTLEKTHKTFPELSPYSKELCKVWPPAVDGLHQRFFADGKVQLLLLFGDANDTLPELHATVDAWYLDGFAPSKNPEMWTDMLFDQIARLSHQGTRFATFTAAGFVRRALQARGFQVEKAPGYGRKRERLIGIMVEPEDRNNISEKLLPEWASIPKPKQTSSTIIIGSGIAGSSLGHMLHKQGHKVTLISDRNIPAGSYVPAAILSPGFQRSKQPASVFATTCFTHACSYPFYEQAWSKERGVKLTSSDPDEQNRLKEIVNILQWDKEWLIPTEGGYILPKSGSLLPQKVLELLQATIPIHNATTSRIDFCGGQWTAYTDNGTYTADNIVIACAMNSDLIIGTDHQLDLRPKPGQIEITGADTQGMPSGNHAYGGYVTAELTSKSNTCYRTIGSTFEVSPQNGRDWPEPTTENTIANLQCLHENTGSSPPPDEIIKSWAGTRATTPDYMPYVGPVPEWSKAADQFQLLSKDRKLKGLGNMPYQQGLYLLTGFGAKGFQQAPLCAAYIASLICNAPLPFMKSMLPYLHPARHMIKSIIRNKSHNT